MIQSDFNRFMDRSCGRWTSNRRYLFGKNRTKGEYVTDFVIESPEENRYDVTWSGKTEGVMELVVEGNLLKRSRTYFDENDGSTSQVMSWIDQDAVVFYTSYDGTRFREEIRFLDDNTRLRQTVGWDLETNDITLCGQYFEERVV